MPHSLKFLRESWILLLMIGLVGFSSSVRADENLWEVLRTGNAVVLIRHALAPGTGDPSSFQLEDCATQRNLSEEGRRQAREIGAAFRQNGIDTARVVSSRWCRCLETARLLDLGAVEPLPALDSFFATREHGPKQTAELHEFISKPYVGPLRIGVTHQVNITALTGVFPRSGEMVVVQPMADGAIRVLGQIEPVMAGR